MTRHTIELLVLCTTLGGCAQEPEPPADRPTHPLLESAAPPPLNEPLRVRAGAERPPGPVRVPPGQGSALVITRDGRPFTGTLEGDARITIEAARIAVEPASGGALEMAFRLPEGMSLPTAAAFAGVITLSERSGPAGADRSLVLRSPAGLALAETWRQDAKPVIFDLGAGLRIVQLAARETAEGGYVPVEVRLVEGGRPTPLTPGQVAQVRTRAGALDVFVETSSLYTPSVADAGQVRGGYILRAWVVPGR